MERKMSKGRTIRNNRSGGRGGENFLVLEFFFESPLVCRNFFLGI